MLTRRDFMKGSAAIAALGLMPDAYSAETSTHLGDVIGHKGMVTSTHSLASQAGRSILLAGGNAVDAAIATALALGVLQPHATGIAGYGGTMVIYLAKENRVVAIDHNCRAPKAAREDMYKLDPSGGVNSDGLPLVVDRANHWGPMSIAVPGVIAGLCLASEKYGKLGWTKCIEPALKLAADGHKLSGRLPTDLKAFAEKADSESVRALFPDGRVPKVGDVWMQKDLARLLETLAADPHSFYRGETARKIVARVRASGGILTEQDMADYACAVSEPLTLDYNGVTVNACPGMNGSSCVLETLALMRRLNPAGEPMFWADLADALVLAWQDRLKYVGDIPGMAGKVRELLSDAHVSELAKLVRSGKVPKEHGGPDPTKETAHLSVCDAEHNIVSLTQTMGGTFGSRFAVPGLGIVLGHGMSRFDPRPGLPNSPGPGKHPLQNMSPVILTKAGRPLGAVGLPGGRMIQSAVICLVMDIAGFGMTPAKALAAPRIHSQGGPIWHSDGLTPAAQREIKSRGHELHGPRRIGGDASVILLKDGSILGAAQASGGAVSI